MTEPQAWTLIGVFAAGLFGMITLMSTMFVRIIKTEIGSVRSEIGSLRSEIHSEFRGVHQRIDRLDSDVNALMKHTFGIQRD
ncbi:hypothetical protein DY023_16630 [Microbacterium bovistercoris]|uniref:Uncharacterized protein n=1 Tax=Microbacterium bovistercoris TaxID=2293570 RepID=A0A371NPN8_9MICO|nr:hypothetical protein DY023_16630 [Microbacterium bovistercoris]